MDIHAGGIHLARDDSILVVALWDVASKEGITGEVRGPINVYQLARYRYKYTPEMR